MRHSRSILGLALCALSALTVGARSPARTAVGFSLTTNIGFGNELFVVGSHEDIGGWEPTQGAKLYWTSGNVWTGQVGVQAGTSLNYKFVVLPNAHDGYCEPGNVQWIPPGVDNHSTVQIPGEPPAPYAGKTVFYHSGLSNVSIIYSSDGGPFMTNLLSVVGDGRTPGEYLHKVEDIGEAGASIEFFMTGFSGGPIVDFAPYEGYGTPPSNTYFTTLDAFMLQDGQIYNYWPPASVSASRIINSNVVSTFPPSPGRTMRIYLPRGYAENTWKRYPVNYMHDGENVFSPASIGSWDAEFTADKEISQGRMREVIIVGLNSSGSLRAREYLPPEDNSGGQGFGDVYTRFLTYDVKAKLDLEFRTLPDRANTLTIGASSGGLITTYLGWATNVFGKIGPFSPAYVISPNFNNRINAEPKQDLRIFTQTGNVGGTEILILPDTWVVLDYLLQDGYAQNKDLVSRIGCGDAHGETAWRKWLPDCYHFLLSLWDEPNLIAQVLHPPVGAGATVAANGAFTQSLDSLHGFAYRLERAPAPDGPWIGVVTSAVESMPWASISIADPDPPGTDGSVLYRTVAEPRP